MSKEREQRMEQVEVAQYVAERMATAAGRQKLKHETFEEGRARIERKLTRIYQEELLGKTYENALDWARSDWDMWDAIAVLKNWAIIETRTSGKSERVRIDYPLLNATWGMTIERFADIAYGVDQGALATEAECREAFSELRKTIGLFKSEREEP